MPFVLDCSQTMAWIFPDEATPASDALRDSLLQDVAVVPALWHLEVGNVLLVALRRGRIQAADLTRIQAALQALPIEVDYEVPERVWKSILPLATQHGLSAYDAAYLELAIRLQLPLATLDQDLRAACATAKVKAIIAVHPGSLLTPACRCQWRSWFPSGQRSPGLT